MSKYPFDCITDLIFVETPVESADIILIPGSDQGVLMETAAELYKKSLAPIILPSGGYNPNLPDYSSEWEFLYKIGVSKDVPSHVILKEDKAKNTFENATFSWEIISKNSLRIEKAIIVCKSYHSRRALLTYQSRFPANITFYVYPIIDDTGISKSNWYMCKEKTEMVMQEVRKIGLYFEEEIDLLYNKALEKDM